MPSYATSSVAPELHQRLGPIPSGTFESIELAEQYLKDYGFQYGWMVKQSQSYPNVARRKGPFANWVQFVCNKAWNKDELSNDIRSHNGHESKQRKVTGSIRTKCPFSLKLFRDTSDGKSWTFEVLTDDKSHHNHMPYIHPSAEPRHRITSISL
jgi:hypothetical protein